MVVPYSAPYCVREGAHSVPYSSRWEEALAYGEGSCTPVAGRPGVYDLRAYNPSTGTRQRRRVKNCPNRRAALAELEKFQKQLIAIGPSLDMNCSVEQMWT